MLKPEEKKQLERVIFRAKILWAFFFSALASYLIIGHDIGTAIGNKLDNFTFWVVTATPGVITCVILATTYFFKKLMLNPRPSNPILRIIQKMFSSVTPPFPLYSRYSRSMSRYIAVQIICIAFSESVGIFGLVLFLISGKFVILYSFIIISALALYYFRPKFKELEQFFININFLEESM
jgi:hypothetical protein